MSWQKVKLGDLCTIEKGKTGIQKAIPGEFPLVVTAEERKSHNEYQFDDEAVIIPLVSGTGHGHASIKRLHFQSGKFALGSILCAVIPKDKSILNAEYLFRFLNLNKERELVDRMKGMANVTLPIKEIAKIEIPLPSLDEQIIFVEKYALLEVDSEYISNEMEYQLDLIKQLRQAFLREAMQGKLCHAELVSASQETGQQLLAKIKAEKAQLIADKKLKKEKELLPITADEIPYEVPKPWAWCRLHDIVELHMGQSPEGDSYNKNGNGFPFYQGKTEFGVMYPVGVRVWCNQPKKISQINDILISVRAPVGDVNISDKEYAIGRGLSIIRVINNTVNHLFLFYFLESIKKNWNSKGSFFDAINRDIIEARLFPLPPLNEQEQIVDKLKELLKFCDGLEQSIKESQGYNEMLLQQVLREALQGN